MPSICKKLNKRSVTKLFPLMPVRTRPISTHGVFGAHFVQGHMMADDRWTLGSLTEQFGRMSELLSKHTKLKILDCRAKLKRFVAEHRKLKRECFDGRIKMNMLKRGASQSEFQRLFKNHTEMKRMYNNMALNQVVENIDQHTFALRKERDRLQYRLQQMQKTYNSKLMEAGNLECRIVYENEFRAEEEKKIWELMKLIKNSDVRLQAVKTVQFTYKKIIQTLRHDATFYEPILDSLSDDIAEQATFIKQLFDIGLPGMCRLNELKEEYRQMEQSFRKAMNLLNRNITDFRNSLLRRTTEVFKNLKTQQNETFLEKLARQKRDAPSIRAFQSELDAVEETIKKVKFVTLCSQVREIYPRIKHLEESNAKLMRMIENDIMSYDCQQFKAKRCNILQQVLMNNLTDLESMHLKKIEELKEAIQIEDETEASNLEYIKNRADVYVLFRFALWKLNDIMRHIGQPSKMLHVSYPVSYLKLPFLKFEMLSMHAVPPSLTDTNVLNLMSAVKKKLRTLMEHFNTALQLGQSVEELSKEYQQIFVDKCQISSNMDFTENFNHVNESIEQDSKEWFNVPTSTNIKAQSARLVEENIKRVD